jgi:hypothetical protein
MRTIRATHPKWNTPPIVALALLDVWPVCRAGFEACSDGVNLFTKVVFAIFEEKTF